MVLDKEKLNQVITLFKEKTEKTCCKIEIIKGKPEIIDDKLGGFPYLPVGENYPTDKNGNPLSLLMQVNLKKVNLPNFPKEGILEVFTNNEFPCEYSVKLFKEGLEYQKEFPKLDYKFPFVAKPLKIALANDVAYMSLNDYKIDSVLCPVLKKVYGIKARSVYEFQDLLGEIVGEDISSQWFEEFCNNIPVHKMTLGGYADFTQNDPRTKKNKLDECLFKIDGGIEPCKEISIGDNGIVWGLISTKDLKKQNFNNAVVDWDCL